MSTQATHLVMVGVSLTEERFHIYQDAFITSSNPNFNSLTDEEHEDLRDDLYDTPEYFCYYNKDLSKKNLTMVQDVINGDYYYVGKVLARSVEYGGLKEINLSFKSLNKKRKKVIKKLKELDFVVNPDKVELITLTHYQ